MSALVDQGFMQEFLVVEFLHVHVSLLSPLERSGGENLPTKINVDHTLTLTELIVLFNTIIFC